MARGARSPLKLLRHFTAGDGRCVMPLLHTAGGLVGGDQLEIGLHAAAGSRSFLTSVAAQKIYGSRGRSRVQPQGRWAQISLQAELEAGRSGMAAAGNRGVRRACWSSSNKSPGARCQLAGG